MTVTVPRTGVARLLSLLPAASVSWLPDEEEEEREEDEVDEQEGESFEFQDMKPGDEAQFVNPVTMAETRDCSDTEPSTEDEESGKSSSTTSSQEERPDSPPPKPSVWW